MWQGVSPQDLTVILLGLYLLFRRNGASVLLETAVVLGLLSREPCLRLTQTLWLAFITVPRAFEVLGGVFT